jgi:hypothetical protein
MREDLDDCQSDGVAAPYVIEFRRHRATPGRARSRAPPLQQPEHARSSRFPGVCLVASGQRDGACSSNRLRAFSDNNEVESVLSGAAPYTPRVAGWIEDVVAVSRRRSDWPSSHSCQAHWTQPASSCCARSADTTTKSYAFRCIGRTTIGKPPFSFAECCAVGISEKASICPRRRRARRS